MCCAPAVPRPGGRLRGQQSCCHCGRPGPHNLYHRYRRARLIAAGYDVREESVEYASDLDLDQLVGGIYSVLGAARLPASDQRPAFAEQVRGAVAPHQPLTEHVRVAMLLGRAA